jgi:transcriptional regulator, lytR family
MDVNFEKCVFDGETYENVKVGVIVKDIEKAKKYLKKYKYMHLKAGRNLVYNSSDNSYYYTGSWAFNNDKAYPTVFDGK